MSYVETRVLLQRLLDQHDQFVSWARFQAEGMRDEPLHFLAAKVADNAITRRDALRDALQQSDATALATQLQYEKRGAPDEAIRELPQYIITDVDRFIGATSGFWGAVLEQLDLLAREASGTSAEAIYKRLASETESVASSEAWAARPE